MQVLFGIGATIIVKMLLGIILSFAASAAIGSVWFSKSAFGSTWMRHYYGDRWQQQCPKGAMVVTMLGSAGTMIMLASLFR